MRPNDYPEFSNIRSHIQRAEAQRNYEIGLALADAIVDAGDFLGRAVTGVASFVRRAASRGASR